MHLLALGLVHLPRHRGAPSLVSFWLASHAASGVCRWSRAHRAPKVVTRSVLANRYCGLAPKAWVAWIGWRAAFSTRCHLFGCDSGLSTQDHQSIWPAGWAGLVANPHLGRGDSLLAACADRCSVDSFSTPNLSREQYAAYAWLASCTWWPRCLGGIHLPRRCPGMGPSSVFGVGRQCGAVRFEWIMAILFTPVGLSLACKGVRIDRWRSHKGTRWLAPALTAA